MIHKEKEMFNEQIKVQLPFIIRQIQLSELMRDLTYQVSKHQTKLKYLLLAQVQGEGQSVTHLMGEQTMTFFWKAFREYIYSKSLKCAYP